MLPRYGELIKPRIHDCDACLFAVLGVLSNGMSDTAMEAVCKMSHALINIEFEQLLYILDDVLDDQLFLMNDEEKGFCVGSADSCEDIVYYIDGCDFALEAGSNAWMYKTHKTNIPKRTALRAQVLVDSFWGYFRGLVVGPPGLENDQGMMKDSEWNNPNVLTSANEYVGGDSGYWATMWINMLKPFSQTELENKPDLQIWNMQFNADRGIIERSFAIIKERFGIFRQPWTRKHELFPIALRVCLKLLNRYWSIPGNKPPGLMRQEAKDEYDSECEL